MVAIGKHNAMPIKRGAVCAKMTASGKVPRPDRRIAWKPRPHLSSEGWGFSVARKQRRRTMGVDRENAIPARRFSEHYLEAMEAYAQYCAELAREGREGTLMSIEPPPWGEYLAEYLLEELEGLEGE